MLDNPQGSSMEELVQRMQDRRKQAEQPEPKERPTGGTEETEADEVEESSEYESDDYEAEDGEHESDEYDSEDEHDEGEDEAEEPQSYRVKVDGEEIEVDLDELTSGYQRDRDYRKKTMELAEHRKTLEAKEAQVAEKLKELESFIEQQDQTIDWDELRDTDPSEYLRQKDLQEKRQKAAEKQRKELTEQQQERMQQVVTEQAQALQKAMGPKWTKEQQQKDFETANAYLDSLGVSQEERGNLVDHRLWKMIFDAAKHERLMANKGKVKKEVRKAPKSVKPGQRPKGSNDRLSELQNKLRNTRDKQEQDRIAVQISKEKRKLRGK